jgi:hypothetical protein
MIHEVAEQFGISEEAALRVQATHRCSWRAPFPATDVSRSGRRRCKIAPAPARTPKKEEHKEIAEKGCYYHATTNSTSVPSSASRARNCSLGCSVVRAVYVGAVPVTTSWAADSRVQKAPRPAGDERGGCRSHPPHDERSANLPRERVRVLIRSLPLARGGCLYSQSTKPLLVPLRSR